MTHLETELLKLNQSVLEMLNLDQTQMMKAQECFLSLDKELAQEILFYEQKVNSFELTIDKECENIMALFNPVAVDLRFVLSILKINSALERIGDLAKGIAKHILKLNTPFSEAMVKQSRITEMFEIAISMINDIGDAMAKDDTKLARKVFTKDEKLDEINKKSIQLLGEYLSKNPTEAENGLVMFASVTRLERCGDHIKNIAEELIFHLEAKVLKHKRRRKINYN